MKETKKQPMDEKEQADGAPPPEPASAADADMTPETAANRQDIALLTAENETLRNQLLRKAAEFENYRRRTEEEKTALIRFGNESLIVELLAVIDDFDRSLKAGKEHPDFDSLYRGIELVRGKLMKLLEGRGLRRLDSLGQSFDVHFHDALLQMPKEGVAPHTILDEIEPGYLLHDRVIRHAKVIVAAEMPDHAGVDPGSVETEEISGKDETD